MLIFSKNLGKDCHSQKSPNASQGVFSSLAKSLNPFVHAAFPGFGSLGKQKTRNTIKSIGYRQTTVPKKPRFVPVPKMLPKEYTRKSIVYRKNAVPVPKMLPKKYARKSITWRCSSVPKPYIYNIILLDTTCVVYPYYIKNLNPGE